MLVVNEVRDVDFCMSLLPDLEELPLLSVLPESEFKMFLKKDFDMALDIMVKFQDMDLSEQIIQVLEDTFPLSFEDVCKLRSLFQEMMSMADLSESEMSDQKDRVDKMYAYLRNSVPF